MPPTAMFVAGGPRPRAANSKVIVEEASRARPPAATPKSPSATKAAGKANPKAPPKPRPAKSGAGVVSQPLTQFEKGVVAKICRGVKWTLQQVFLVV